MKSNNTSIQLRVGVVTMLSLLSLTLLTFCAQQTQPLAAPQVENQSQAKNNALTPGITVFAIDPAPVLGIVLDQKMQIVFVEPKGATDRAGLKAGDVLISINSISVAQPREARETFYNQNLSKKTRLIILRNGIENSIEVLPASRMGNPGAPTPTPVPPDMTYF